MRDVETIRARFVRVRVERNDPQTVDLEIYSGQFAAVEIEDRIKARARARGG